MIIRPYQLENQRIFFHGSMESSTLMIEYVRGVLISVEIGMMEGEWV